MQRTLRSSMGGPMNENSQNQALQKVKADNKLLRKEKEDLEKATKELQAHVHQLKLSLDESENSNKKLQREGGHLQGQLEFEKKKYDELVISNKQEIQQLKTKLEEKVNEINLSRETYEKSLRDVENEFHSEIGACGKHLEAKQKELESLQNTQKKQLEEMNNAYDIEINKLKNQLQEKTTECENMFSKYEEDKKKLKENSDDKENQIKELKSKVASFEDVAVKYEKAKSTIWRLEKKLDDIYYDYDSLNKLKKKVEAEKRNMHTDLKFAQREYMELLKEKSQHSCFQSEVNEKLHNIAEYNDNYNEASFSRTRQNSQRGKWNIRNLHLGRSRPFENSRGKRGNRRY